MLPSSPERRRRRSLRPLVASLVAVALALVVVGVSAPAPAVAATVSIRGHVSLGTAAASAPGGTVRVSAEGTEGAPGGAALVDAAGNYELTGLANGFYYVKFTHLAGAYQTLYSPGFVDPNLGAWDYEVGSATPPVVDMVLSPAHTLSGVVTLGTAPAPPGSVTVTLAYLDASDRWTTLFGLSTTTDAAGRYSFGGLSNLQYRPTFTSTDPRYVTTTNGTAVDLSAQNQAQDVLIPAKVAVSGVVLIGTAAPRTAAAGEVRIEVAGSDGVFTALTAADGTYRIAGLDPGRHRLTITYAGTGPFSTTPIVEDYVLPTIRISATIPDLNGITGTVRHGASPVVGATVYLDSYDAATDTFAQYATTTTGSNGTYSFRGIAATDYAVTFFAADEELAGQTWDGDHYYFPELVTVTAESIVEDIDASLISAASVTGRVIGPTADEFAGGYVGVGIQVQDPSSGLWVDTGEGVAVGADGRYVLTGIVPDSYRFDVYYSGPRGEVHSVTSTIALAEGQDRTLATVALSIPASADVPRSALIKALYVDYLGREPGPSEIAFWIAQLNLGRSTTAISQSFVNSDEYRLIRIDAAYRTNLGRPSDTAGRMWWLDQLRAGRFTTDDIEQLFRSSDEYYNSAPARFPSQWLADGAWVDAIYQDLLHRHADAPGLTNWIVRTRAVGRVIVVRDFWNSPETASQRVSAMYAGYLGRAPDPAGLAFWTDLDLRWGDSATRSAFTGSQEYSNLALARYPRG